MVPIIYFKKIKKQRAFMCNARAEKVLDKSYWNSIRSKRCLIPVIGIYEHRNVNSKKIPYYITLKKRKMFCLPGLYAVYKLFGKSFWIGCGRKCFVR